MFRRLRRSSKSNFFRSNNKGSRSSLAEPVQIMPSPGTVLILEEAKTQEDASVKSQKPWRFCRAIRKFFRRENKKQADMPIAVPLLQEAQMKQFEAGTDNEEQTKNVIEHEIDVREPVELLANNAKDTAEEPDRVEVTRDQTEEKAEVSGKLSKEAENPQGATLKSRRCSRFCRTICKLFRCKTKESVKDSVSSPDHLSLEELTEKEEQAKEEIEIEIEIKDKEEETRLTTQECLEDTDEESNPMKVTEEQIKEKSVPSILETEDENPPEGTETAVIITDVIECPSDASISDAAPSSIESVKDSVPTTVQISLEDLTENEELIEKEVESEEELKAIEEEAEVQIQEPLENIESDKEQVIEEQTEEKPVASLLEGEAETPPDAEGTEISVSTSDASFSGSAQSATESVEDSVPTSVQLSLEDLTENVEQAEKECESAVELEDLAEEDKITTQELLDNIAEDTDEECDHIKVTEEQTEEESVSGILEIETETPPDAEGTEKLAMMTSFIKCPSDPSISDVLPSTIASKKSLSDPIQITPSPGAVLIIVEEAKIQLGYISEDPAPSLAASCIVPLEEQEYPKTEEKGDDVGDPVNIEPCPGVMLVVVQEAETASECTPEDTSVLSISDAKSSLMEKPKESSKSKTESVNAPEKLQIPLLPGQVEELPEIEGASAPQEAPGLADQRMSWNSLEGYNFCKWLGKGTYGEVFLAEHKETCKMVAIKRMEKTAIFKAKSTKCVFLEKNMLKLARDEKNPFLVGFVCTFQREHNLYMAMEFASGGDLSGQLENGKLPLNSTLFYSSCIVLGLKFLHDRNIVHRDLKPENVLIDSKGYAKLGDFGLCKTGIGYGVEMKYPCGTLPYMAPEMFSRKIYDRTVDWWALGVMMYQMAVGKLPFTGTSVQLRKRIVDVQPKYPGWLDYDTCGVIRGFLKKDNNARLGSLKKDGEQVMRYRYFKKMNWEALKKRRLTAPFVPGPYVKADTEDQKATAAALAATRPEFLWPVYPKVQEAFREFDELPEAP